MNIESDIKAIFERLELKALTHPKLCIFWKKYISRKIDMLNNIIIECNSIMETLTLEQADIEPETLTIAYLLASTLRSGTALE